MAITPSNAHVDRPYFTRSRKIMTRLNMLGGPLSARRALSTLVATYRIGLLQFGQPWPS